MQSTPAASRSARDFLLILGPLALGVAFLSASFALVLRPSWPAGRSPRDTVERELHGPPEPSRSEAGHPPPGPHHALSSELAHAPKLRAAPRLPVRDEE